MNDSDGIVKEFLVESYENLDRLDRELVGLEKTLKTAMRLAACFAPSTPSREPVDFWVSTNWKR